MQANGAGSTTADGYDAARDSWRKSVDYQTDQAFQAMERNALLNLTVRGLLYLGAISALALAIFHSYRRGDDMVIALLDNDRDFNEARFLALMVPVGLLLLLGVTCMIAAVIIQRRGMGDFEDGLQGISRLRREAHAGVTRTRPMTHIVEEFISNGRSAFRLQLWLSRTLFVVCLVLLVAAVADAIVHTVNAGTVALAAGSLISLLLGKLEATGHRVATHLGDATQLQLIVSGAARQVDALEEYLYKAIEAFDRKDTDVAACAAEVRAGVNDVSGVTRNAVKLIQVYAEPEGDSEKQMAQAVAGNSPR